LSVSHCTAPRGAGIAEGLTGRQQVRVLLVELIFEPAEGSFALDGPRQLRPAGGTNRGWDPASGA